MTTEVEKQHSDSPMQAIKAQLSETRKHRQALMKKLDELEDQHAKADDFYRRALLSLSQLIETEQHHHLEKHLAELKNQIKKRARTDQLDAALRSLKDAAFKTSVKEQPPQPVRPKIQRVFSRFLKNEIADVQAPREKGLDNRHLKESFQEIIDELRLNLGKKDLMILQGLETRLQGTRSTDDFISIRKALMALINDYIARISKEREEAAAFIREIGARLVDVEQHMRESLVFVQNSQKVSSSFTETLGGQLSKFKASVDSSENLSELKNAVASRLSAIETVIENKRRDDTDRLKQSDQKMRTLNKNLSEMKTEIQTAWQRAKKLEGELLIDPLTEIYNRRAYDRRMDEEFERFNRYGNVFSLLVIDVDHFKRINDRYGHSVGDLCLKEIIKRLKPMLRRCDFLARYGGEEFVVMLTETPSKSAVEVAEKLRKTIEATSFIHKGDPVGITISIGLTEVTPSDKQYKSIFERADKAMYAAKQSGRNRIAVS